MKVHQLQYLIAIADKGSVRAAAQTLGLSPAAVSRALIELEDELNTSLLLRQSVGAALTDAGRALVLRGRLILGQIDEATREVQRGRRQEDRTLSVGVTPWLAESILPEVLTRFRSVLPETRVFMAEILGSSHDGLRDGIYDLAIGLSPPADTAAEFQETKLFSYQAAVMCRKGHPLANARTLDELREATWILSRDLSLFASPLREVLQEAFDDPHSVRVHYARTHRIVDSLTGATDMLTICPWPMVEATEIRDFNQAINLQELSGESVISLLTRRNIAPSTAVEQFTACFFDEIGEALISKDASIRRVFNVVEYLPAPDGDAQASGDA